ncbi:MAG: VOC family protein [Crocinitomicaceae bacterium]|nr:VOC family protein [Crocinitomicaceae bacterium]
MYARINGLQHIGVAVSDMELSLKFYRKFFGLDIPFFDAVASAPLMQVYTRGETIVKRASMIMNLQGGCAIEVIRPTSFEPCKPSFDIALGDLGILITQIKCRDIFKSYEYCKEQNAPCLSEMQKNPSGRDTFFISDPDGNRFQYLQGKDWYSNTGHHSGGVEGCSVGVTDIEQSFGLYKNILGFDQIVYDVTGKFDEWSSLHGGEGRFRRVLLSQSRPVGGGFARVTGKTFIELIQALDRKPRYIFQDRIWADTGFAHIGFDVKGMNVLGKELANSGFAFRCDSRDALDMGTTKVHCTYIDDYDKTPIEMIEVYKVPIIEKWGIYLNVEKRDPLRPLPDFMLKALRFSRIRD